LSEKTIWQAIENTGIAYTDWLAYKKPGESTLKIFIEPQNGSRINEAEISQTIYESITRSDENTRQLIPEEYATMINFKVDVSLLPVGTFANYTAAKQAEGADLAHLKPPHINPPETALSQLLAETEEIVVVKKARVDAKTSDTAENDQIGIVKP
jgi:hypothetical protein